MSFMNAGKRVASSSKNFMIFGANVKEDGKVVRNYINDLVEVLKYLESQVQMTLMGRKSKWS